MNATNRRYCSHCSAAFVSSIDRCPRDGADLRSFETNPLIGQVFGNRYRLVERLGAGGMGEVYRAEHATIGKSFAIKVLLGEVAADNSMVARFRREAKALSLLSHRNIVAVADFGETEAGLLYLVTEFIDGTPLSRALETRAFEIDRIIHVVRQIAKALSHAHRRGLVHRDLKPDNVMLVQGDDESDIVKVLDFGIARVADTEASESQSPLTTQGIIMGTPGYMSPEQALGTVIDHRADLYSLGILMYELLAGKLPFQGISPVEIMSKHLREIPAALVREDITQPFKALTMRLLEKDPKNRCADADTFLDALESLAETRPSGTYLRLHADTEESFPFRQGSATLLAPATVDTDADTDAPADLHLAPSAALVANEKPPRRRLVAISAGAIVAASAVAALIYNSGESAEQRDDASTTDRVADGALASSPSPAVTAKSVEAVQPEDKVEPVALVLPLDAGAPVVAIDADASPRRKKQKEALTQEMLRMSLERAGSSLDAIAQDLDKSQVDSLRQRWLDLATELGEVEDSENARRAFAVRIRKLRSSIQKASISK